MAARLAGKALTTIDRWIARQLIRGVRAYQVVLSPLMGRQCRFYPTCSHYASEALALHGSAAGCRLTIRRILRCHPFHPGGVDLVPDHTHKSP